MKRVADSQGEPARRAGGITAVERCLAILDAFLGQQQSRGLSELARATQLAKPTVLRNLVSLERMGYVVRLVDGRYQLGARLLQLGETYRAHFRLEDHVLPVLRELAAVTGESAAFQVREHDKRVTLFRVESPQSVRDVQALPRLLPLDGTSVSLALLQADWTGDMVAGRQRVFYTAGRLNPQTASLSTVVYGVDGAISGALNISGPIERVSAADLPALARSIGAAAARLSGVLGAKLPLGLAAPELIRS